jgi:hypothetical protein
MRVGTRQKHLGQALPTVSGLRCQACALDAGGVFGFGGHIVHPIVGCTLLIHCSRFLSRRRALHSLQELADAALGAYADFGAR